jgi:hypothetical protein
MPKTISYFTLAGLLFFAGAFFTTRAQILEPGVRVTPYTVFDPVNFSDCDMPARALVFRNGVYMTPLLDYQVIAGRIHFRDGVLSAGDLISVVTLHK